MLSNISVRNPRSTSRSQNRLVLLSRASTLLLPLSLAGSFFLAPAPSQAHITPAQTAIHNARLAKLKASHSISADPSELALHNARLARRQAVRQAHLAMQHPAVQSVATVAQQKAQHQARLAKLQAKIEMLQAADAARSSKILALHQARLLKAQARQQARLAAHQAKLAVDQQKNGLKYAKLHQQHIALTSGNVVEAAYAFRGTRYVMGGTSRSGFDCSGFVRYILSNAGGVDVPRTAVEQFIHGAPIAPAAMQPGDLVFFKNTYKHGISHVGIYAGNGQFIHAANAHKGVRMDSLNEPYYVAHFAGARRVLPAQIRAGAFLGQ